MTEHTEKTESEGWQAHLNLRYATKGGRTILAENRHRGPLTVQRPLYPESEVCHTYLLHPPGGVVGGDSLYLDVEVEENSAALITTPGATKFYRCENKTAIQKQYLKIKGGSLEWFPQDTIIYPGSRARVITEVHLDSSARFIGWEATSLGLPSQQKWFTSGTFTSSFRLFRDKTPLFLDILRIEKKEDLHNQAGLRGFPVSGTFLATGVEREILPELRELLPVPDHVRLCNVTLMRDILVGRYLGSSTFEARSLFETLWNRLRPELMNRPPCPPRIWAT